MKTLKRLLPVLIVALVLCVGVVSAFGATRGSSSFNTTLAAMGIHSDICYGSKSNTSSYATLYAQTENNYAFVAWIDGPRGQATDSVTCISGNNTLYYNRYVPNKGDSLTLRGSTTGLFSSAMWISGTVNFN